MYYTGYLVTAVMQKGCTRYMNGFSQEDLARKLGVNESTVFHYEKGTHKPKSRLRQILSSLFSEVDRRIKN